MLIDKILKLGNPLLYKKSQPVRFEELESLSEQIALLHNLIIECRNIYGFGRGIAAPQIGLMKRIICLHLNGKKYTVINPQLKDFSTDMITLWDDCMSFPNLLVKVKRHRSCRLSYHDEYWEGKKCMVEDDISELIQHEYDHLEGILATQRAIDNQSFKLK